MVKKIKEALISKGSEEQIAELVIAWLEEQHWEVYQEVSFWSGGSTVDIIAKKENILWAIEVKKRLNFDVIAQADNNLNWFHFSSVAVPSPSSKKRHYGVPHNRNRDMAKRICKDYGIGVIEISRNVAFDGISYIHRYDNQSYVNETVAPKLIRKNHKWVKDQCLPRLMPEHKTYAKAGSKGGAHFTPYRATMENIKRILATHPGSTLKEIISHLKNKHHYSPQSVTISIRHALSNWEYEWCASAKDTKPYKYYLRDSDEYKKL